MMTMRRGAILLLAVLASPLPLASASVGSDNACVEPEPTLNYTSHGIAYALDIDLARCEWWDHSPIRLEATLARRDTLGADQSASAVALCGRRLFEIDAYHDDSHGRHIGLSPCDVMVTFRHGSPDAAHYHGEISFPWEDGRKWVSFDALCTSAGGVSRCRD